MRRLITTKEKRKINYSGSGGDIDDTWKVIHKALTQFFNEGPENMAYCVAHVLESNFMKGEVWKEKYRHGRSVNRVLSSVLRRAARKVTSENWKVDRKEDPIQLIGVMEYGKLIVNTESDRLHLSKMGRDDYLGLHIHLFLRNKTTLSPEELINSFKRIDDVSRYLFEFTKPKLGEDIYDLKGFGRYHVKQSQTIPLINSLVYSRKLGHLFPAPCTD